MAGCLEEARVTEKMQFLLKSGRGRKRALWVFPFFTPAQGSILLEQGRGWPDLPMSINTPVPAQSPGPAHS